MVIPSSHWGQQRPPWFFFSLLKCTLWCTEKKTVFSIIFCRFLLLRFSSITCWRRWGSLSERLLPVLFRLSDSRGKWFSEAVIADVFCWFPCKRNLIIFKNRLSYYTVITPELMWIPFFSELWGNAQYTLLLQFFDIPFYQSLWVYRGFWHNTRHEK